MCADHVLLFSLLCSSRYFTISYTFVSGLDHILKNIEKISLWIFPSIGSSPVRKCMEGVGAVKLSFKIDFRVFLWNIERGSKLDDLKANEESPDLATGQVNVLKI